MRKTFYFGRYFHLAPYFAAMVLSLANTVYAGVSEAARCGYAILTGGGSAVNAVEAAVACMENNPIFNAG